jgi:hypothetical protein
LASESAPASPAAPATSKTSAIGQRRAITAPPSSETWAPRS